MPDLGQNIGPFPRNYPKMLSFTPNYLILHFGKDFMKIGTKRAKLQLRENLHKNVNENMFSFTFICKFSLVFYEGQLKKQICYSYILLISYMSLNQFKMVVQFF